MADDEEIVVIDLDRHAQEVIKDATLKLRGEGYDPHEVVWALLAVGCHLTDLTYAHETRATRRNMLKAIIDGAPDMSR